MSVSSIAETDSLWESSGTGTDTIDFKAISTAVRLNLAWSSIQSAHTNRSVKLNAVNTFENVAGGSGDDVLIGNGGIDQLNGATGRDILIGGLGLDRLNGGADDDILITGTTTFNSVFANFVRMSSAWSAATAYASRVGHYEQESEPRLSN